VTTGTTTQRTRCGCLYAPEAIVLSTTLAIAEAAVNIGLAVLLTWPVRAPLGAVFAAVPRRYALFILASLGLMLAGHVASRGDATYPLTGWDMYTVSNPADPRFVDYVAVRADGREERVFMGQLFPAGGRHFRARLDAAAFAIEQSPPGQNAESIARLDSMLAAVAMMWRTQHPADSLLSIRLMVGSVPAQHYAGPASISRNLLREYRPQ